SRGVAVSTSGQLARFFCLSLLLLVAASGPLEAAAETPALHIPRVERPPTLEDFAGMRPNGEVDGKLAKVEGLIQRIPRNGQPASQRTEVYLGYDDENLYVIFVCFDTEPQHIRARLGRREDVFSDDVVEVMLDTFNDKRRAYAFVTTPRGIQRDAIWTEGQGFDGSFDTLWHTRGQITGEGYLAWFSIPFKSLRFPSTPQQTWGIILRRDIPRVNESSLWPHVSSEVEGRLNQAATLRGLENISPGRNLQFIPYASFRSFRAPDFRDRAQPRFAEEAGEVQAGLDAKIIFQDSLVLDVTANPDFAQVESDEPQVTVNQRFEVFFPEKRPFFLENAGYFATPLNLVFTRRIADPRLGARLTGKRGPYAIGALVVDDEAPGKLAPPGDPLHGSRALVSILRGSRDFFRQSSLGFIYAGRELEASYNRVAGLDGRFKFAENWVANFQGVTSWTRGLDASRSTGPAYDVEVVRDGRQFYYFTGFSSISPGFVTQLGFVPRTDVRHWRQFASYKFRPEGKGLIAWGPESNTEVVYDHQSTRLDLTQDTEFGAELMGRTFFFVFYNWDRERLRPVDFGVLAANRDFERNRKGFSMETAYWRWLTLAGNYSWGTRINFAPPDGEEPSLADVTAATAVVTLRPLTSLLVDNRYLHTRLTHRGDGRNVFNNHIIRSNWNWQFTREFSLRVILQYDALLANPEHTALETRKNFNADFLFTYLLHPGTAIFIGYNGNAQNLDPGLFVCEGPGVARAGCPELAAGRSALLRPRDRLINDARQFFVKVSYLFRF
ncbi:MAG: DUF5916 domain-containing protein, partial [Candidatus Acidiferrales bacterium]